MFKNFNLNMIDRLYKFYQSQKDDFFRNYSESDFKNTFINNKEKIDYDASFVYIVNDEIKAAIICTFVAENAFISFLLVDNNERRKKIATQLLEKAENELRKKQYKKIRLVFLNPFNFAWYVPGKFPHEHPNMPAIPINSSLYFFYVNHQFISIGFIDGFYLELEKFNMSDKVKKIKNDLLKEEIDFSIYNKDKHTHVYEFAKGLNNSGFENAVINAVEKEKKLLVGSHKNKVIAFTGPIETEKSGRGYLAGVAVDNQYGGKGVGKALFSTLCQLSKENGAQYMTFFTGVDNVARKIYLSAGFKIVQSFAIMEKQL